MTEHEFEQWFQLHVQTFDMRKWALENQMAMDVWFKALGHYSVEHLNRATEELIASPNCPKFPRDHIGAIKLHLQAIAAQTPDDERFPTGKWREFHDYNPETGLTETKKDYDPHCLYCIDRGFVSVYLPAAVKCFRRHIKAEKWDSSEGHYLPSGAWCRHRIAVSCCCERGQANGMTRQKFNPQTMLVWDYLDTTRLETPQLFMERPRAAPVSQAYSGTDKYFTHT